MPDGPDFTDAQPFPPCRRVLMKRVSRAETGTGSRTIPHEVPVAMVFNGSTEAVLMATPADLEDFAIGFGLTEGMISHRSEIRRLEMVHTTLGIEARLWIEEEPAAVLAARRRSRAGPTGCGLCGIESLEEAVREVPEVRAMTEWSPEDVFDAIATLDVWPGLGTLTRAVHAAGLWMDGRLQYVREDVGRHNALDKLAGAAATGGERMDRGMLLLTSRVSIELVQKAAMIGVPLLVAMSAPTALAIKVAEAVGVTLIAVARHDAFEIYSHAWRIAAPGNEGAEGKGHP